MVKPILYTIDCTRCKVLETLLNRAGIAYDVCRDKDIMLSKGMREAPGLEVDGRLYDFIEARKWLQIVTK